MKLGTLLGAVLLTGVVSAQGANNCSSATPIGGTGTFSFNNASATNDGPPACVPIGRDVWFAWTASATDTFTLDTCSSFGFDSVLVVYNGTSCPASGQVACDDDGCGTLFSRTSFSAVNGNSYLIRIGTYAGGAGGNGTLTIAQGGPTGGCPMPASGPDVIVGDLNGVNSYGGTGGISAFSLGTTSCNVGDAELLWFAGNNDHPVIAQHIFRYDDGRFEQIGQSWLKHGFTALQQSLCCDCLSSGTGTRLGVGCSDPYTAGLNGQQSNLGPKFEVNAHTGFFQWPHFADGMTGNVIYKRIQVDNDDLNPSMNPGALYYGEGHYIANDDAAAGNGNNNASYRRMTVGSFSGGGYNMSLTGPTIREDPAIMAWKVNQPAVQIEDVQVPGEGLFLVGSHCTDNGDGTWHYEYAIQNLNSHASGGSFSVPVPAGINVTNIDFHDVDYHSGEPFSGTDWTAVRGANDVSWSTADFASNPNANALRWGTLYNFRFDADAGPVTGSATLGMFRPHTPSSVAVNVCAPECTIVTASETIRLGSPPNPNALLPGQTSGPVVGQTWDPVIDHTTFFPTAFADVLAINPDGAQINVPSSIGTVLCNIPAPAFIFLSLPTGTPFGIAIPDVCDLVGLSVCAQGASFGGGVIQLTNAIDTVIGNQ